MGMGDDNTLIRVAVFGLTVSLMCSVLVTLLVPSGLGYDYDDIVAGRTELVDFSGTSMTSATPWYLTGVYTAWSPELGYYDHVDADNWLYGEKITDYSEIGKAANIKLDVNQKSSSLLAVGETQTFTYQTGKEIWSEWWTNFIPGYGLYAGYKKWSGADPYTYTTYNANTWSFTGYRYVFDPSLPFSYNEDGTNKTSTVDGSLSLVWYSYNGTEGLSGGLQVYGGPVLLASYAASDIISAYNTSSGLATTYDFNFEGTILQLSIRFDQSVLASGVSPMQAWTQGDWSMAISSVGAGNFYDIENSNAFSATVGSVFTTFTQIFTFSVPSLSPWMQVILWLLCGLPCTIAMLCITMRAISGVVKVF